MNSRGDSAALMELVAGPRDLSREAERDRVLQPMEGPLSGLRIGVVVTNDLLEGLNHQTRDGGLTLDGKVLDLPQQRLGHDEGDVLVFHRSTFYGCCREKACSRKQV